jgi:hypothetical protein
VKLCARRASSSAYGAAGSLVVVIVWVYYSAMIFLFGAEFTHVLDSGGHGQNAKTSSKPPLLITRRSAGKLQAASAKAQRHLMLRRGLGELFGLTLRADIALYFRGHGSSSAVLQICELMTGDQFDHACPEP